MVYTVTALNPFWMMYAASLVSLRVYVSTCLICKDIKSLLDDWSWVRNICLSTWSLLCLICTHGGLLIDWYISQFYIPFLVKRLELEFFDVSKLMMLIIMNAEIYWKESEMEWEISPGYHTEVTLIRSSPSCGFWIFYMNQIWVSPSSNSK